MQSILAAKALFEDFLHFFDFKFFTSIFWLPERLLVRIKKEQNLFVSGFLIIVIISALLIIDIIMLYRASNPMDPPTVTQALDQELELI